MQQTELDALRKACLYSLPPNQLGYCGPKQSWQSFQEFLSTPSDALVPKTKGLLSEFYAMFPYLELIAEANSLEPFSQEVIEAYWVGNSLLENIPHSKTQETILSFAKHGMPKSIAERKASGLPQGLLPHHSMHVLYVNFINPDVKPLVQNLSSCLIQWAEVKSLSKKGVEVKGIELISESGELKLREKIKTVQNQFSLGLKPKDLITVHWNSAIESISKDSLKNLKKFTDRTLAGI
ncbi:MAG: hypothetical protein JW744_00565 [Candidatus Diapherotrites archaeon]|uniref:Uncharacterized protein n=1 Tax=Candidatus Iainarchaeum sp. TaxID=3101447 RepID=A0A938YX45_9ARCH|nr:hypothetical protein [Candidatus Diapherotrites archaeon]